MTEQRSMSVFRETALLVRAQLRYRQSTLMVALLLEIGCISFFLLFAEARERWVAAAIAAMLGGLIGVFGMGVDAFERRVRLLVLLPVTRTAVALSRLFGVLVVQALISLVAWLLALGFSLIRSDGAPDVGIFVLAGSWTLVAVYVSFVFEEVNVALSRYRVLVLVLNFGLGIALIPVVLAFDDFFRSAGRAGLWFAVPLMLMMALLALALFLRRKTLDVGINPWHGLPTDWSES